MRGRVWCGIALGVVSTLGGWGCASPPKKGEAPIQFRQWKDPAATASAKEKVRDDSFPATPTPAPSVASTPARASIWNYRPGSLLFRRKPSAPPAMPVGESAGSLSRYFPGLSGRDFGDALRLTRKDRPAKTTEVAVGLAKSSGNRLASNANSRDPVSVLPVGLKIEGYPKAPAPTLPDGMAKAKPAEKPVQPTIAGDERLTSHETTEARVTPVDPLSLDLPTPPAPDPAMSAEDVTSAPAEAPSRMEPAVAASAPAPAPAVEPLLPIKPQFPPSTTIEPIRPSPGTAMMSRPSIAHTVALKSPPKPSRVEPMALPPAEFPPSYHAQSISRVLKEEVTADLDARTVATEPRRPIFPRLAALMRPKPTPTPKHAAGVEDRSVETASHPRSVIAPSRPMPSTVSESTEIPEWWKAG